MKFLGSRRGLVVLGVLLLLALFLVRPGANRLRARIVGSISLAVGRQVEVSSVHVRLLPRPGFDLENFVVHEDPAFGAEPVLRAAEVTASLRLISLLYGRLEIARLSLTEPSLNLVRNREGHWNLENLVERADKIPVAPTNKPKAERRPGFPYIEASSGRINFKFEQEKKAYALTSADFALWQDLENAWGMRLKGQPVRTDFNLSDTGLIRVNGTWQRAASLRDTPLQFTAQWERAQLGQLTKLAYGNDLGWRGTIVLSAALNGTPANLTVSSSASADDFRRYDVYGGGDLRLAAQCSAAYSTVGSTLSHIACQAPVGQGVIGVEGSAASLLTSRSYDLVLTGQGLPMQSLVSLVRHVQQSVPDDLTAAGQLDMKVKLRRTETAGFAWEGGGQTSDFHLGSSLTNTDLTLNSVPFAVSSSVNPKTRRSRDGKGEPQISEVRADIGPLRVALGRPSPVLVRGWIARSGYGFEVQGEAQLQRLLQTARMVAIPALQTSATGWTKFDLQTGGGWWTPATRMTGKAQLHAVRAEMRGWNEPLEIASANVALVPDQVTVQNVIASAAGTSWHGSLVLPRPCALAGTCPLQFDLHADEISVEGLNRLLNPTVRAEPWYRFLSSGNSASLYLLRVNAVGKIAANHVLIHKLAASKVSANVELNAGRLRLSDLHAGILGGNHLGEWKADFATKPPQYTLSGTLGQVALTQLADAMNDGWISGSATATYHASASGLTASELLASATGTLQVQARDGVLPHIVLTEGPLAMRRLAARLVLREGKFEIEDGKLETSDGSYQVSGTVSLDRMVNLKLVREGAPGFNITGSLTAPHVSQAANPETRAALKPVSR